MRFLNVVQFKLIYNVVTTRSRNSAQSCPAHTTRLQFLNMAPKVLRFSFAGKFHCTAFEIQIALKLLHAFILKPRDYRVLQGNTVNLQDFVGHYKVTTTA